MPIDYRFMNIKICFNLLDFDYFLEQIDLTELFLI